MSGSLIVPALQREPEQPVPDNRTQHDEEEKSFAPRIEDEAADQQHGIAQLVGDHPVDDEDDRAEQEQKDR